MTFIFYISEKVCDTLPLSVLTESFTQVSAMSVGHFKHMDP